MPFKNVTGPLGSIGPWMWAVVLGVPAGGALIWNYEANIALGQVDSERPLLGYFVAVLLLLVANSVVAVVAERYRLRCLELEKALAALPRATAGADVPPGPVTAPPST